MFGVRLQAVGGLLVVLISCGAADAQVDDRYATQPKTYRAPAPRAPAPAAAPRGFFNPFAALTTPTSRTLTIPQPGTPGAPQVLPDGTIANPPGATSKSPGGTRPGGTIAYCVRTCDGYFFPLNSARQDRASLEEQCSQLCPQASTDVYVSYSTEMDQAVGPRGTLYGRTKFAFLFRDKRVDNCTCGNISSRAFEILENDETLRKGDLIVMEAGTQPVAYQPTSRFRQMVAARIRGERIAGLAPQRGFKPAPKKRGKDVAELPELPPPGPGAPLSLTVTPSHDLQLGTAEAPRKIPGANFYPDAPDLPNAAPKN